MRKIFGLIFIPLLISCVSSTATIMIPIDEVAAYEKGMPARSEIEMKKDTLRGYDSKMVKITYKEEKPH